jgi:glycosyltransferase involved in cell wall biosynthesis
LEYIIIDGGSNDKTLSIINKYKERIHTFISETDNGLYDAMNKGIKLSTGDLIGILNSDDVFFNISTISEIVHFHNKNNIDASIGNVVQYFKNRNMKRFYSSKDWNLNKLICGIMPPHPSIFFKKHLFNNYSSYNCNFKIASDYEIIIRYFIKNKITWKYSGITTTLMLYGGLSSSGIRSYVIITNEILNAFKLNSVKCNRFRIYFRGFSKMFEFLKVYTFINILLKL